MFILSYKKKSWKKFSGKSISTICKKGTKIVAKSFVIKVYWPLGFVNGELTTSSVSDICKMVKGWRNFNPQLNEKLMKLKNLDIEHIIIVTGQESERAFIDLHISLSRKITLYTEDFLVGRQDISFTVKQSKFFRKNKNLVKGLTNSWLRCYGKNSKAISIYDGVYFIKNPASSQIKKLFSKNLLKGISSYVEQIIPIKRKCFVFRVPKFLPREAFMDKEFNERGELDFTGSYVSSSELNRYVDGLFEDIPNFNWFNACTVHAIAYPRHYLSDEYSLFLILNFSKKKTLSFEGVENVHGLRHFLKYGGDYSTLELCKDVIFPAPTGFTTDKVIELFINSLTKVSQNECLFIQKDVISNTFFSIDLDISFDEPSTPKFGRVDFLF